MAPTLSTNMTGGHRLRCRRLETFSFDQRVDDFDARQRFGRPWAVAIIEYANRSNISHMERAVEDVERLVVDASLRGTLYRRKVFFYYVGAQLKMKLITLSKFLHFFFNLYIQRHV